MCEPGPFRRYHKNHRAVLSLHGFFFGWVATLMIAAGPWFDGLHLYGQLGLTTSVALVLSLLAFQIHHVGWFLVGYVPVYLLLNLIYSVIAAKAGYFSYIVPCLVIVLPAIVGGVLSLWRYDQHYLYGHLYLMTIAGGYCMVAGFQHWIWFSGGDLSPPALDPMIFFSTFQRNAHVQWASFSDWVFWLLLMIWCGLIVLGVVSQNKAYHRASDPARLRRIAARTTAPPELPAGDMVVPLEETKHLMLNQLVSSDVEVLVTLDE